METESLRDVGGRIRKAREERKMTQKQLGEAIGRTESSIAKYEQGKVEMPSSVLRRIAEAVHVDFYELLGWYPGEDAQADAESLRRELNSNFDRLNETGQQKAVETVSDLTEVPKYRKEGEE